MARLSRRVSHYPGLQSAVRACALARRCSKGWRNSGASANTIERRFREVRRRTRSMGVFANRNSIERILFAIFTHENRNQGVSTPFPLTQNS